MPYKIAVMRVFLPCKIRQDFTYNIIVHINEIMNHREFNDFVENMTRMSEIKKLIDLESILVK